MASIAAGVAALGEAVSADSTVAMVASEVSAVVVGIVVAVVLAALVEGGSVGADSVVSAEGSGARALGEWRGACDEGRVSGDERRVTRGES